MTTFHPKTTVRADDPPVTLLCVNIDGGYDTDRHLLVYNRGGKNAELKAR